MPLREAFAAMSECLRSASPTIRMPAELLLSESCSRTSGNMLSWTTRRPGLGCDVLSSARFSKRGWGSTTSGLRGSDASDRRSNGRLVAGAAGSRVRMDDGLSRVAFCSEGNRAWIPRGTRRTTSASASFVSWSQQCVFAIHTGVSRMYLCVKGFGACPGLAFGGGTLTAQSTLLNCPAGRT